MSIEFLENDLDKVNYLSNLLENHATGGHADDAEYMKLRHELLRNSTLASMLPDWLKLHRNLGSFWGFIKTKYGTYAERRTYLSEEFAPVCNYLEFGENLAPKPVEPKPKFPVQQPITQSPQPVFVTPKPKKDKVFIVHGRDNEAKQEVARFIESVGLIPIILHEQASGGKTIIEKIEHYSDEAGYAVVLYTACDHGRGIHETKIHPKQRARQNVVFEHGYLMAKLGRENVCALVKGDIETPNDISGVVYVALDVSGAWKTEIAKELKVSGYQLKEFF
ncbi:nucleotide-binding protein [Sansalvadorimonas sp. 2012CJ34-2]|uniref:Nucleotide-binding protein n=1 Tax=Parendozoicomonas callyspongiae TaxID=2942213 RepID=A0ABT0PLR9_9GAMM|nr:nucleotide-binding protein [Sansalvadorimonas sp. 2012CJ34-2]MCL6272288.1 nucleotide-binding protein [Sansalvadorimonas sp. 2012CJ34-2]